MVLEVYARVYKLYVRTPHRYPIPSSPPSPVPLLRMMSERGTGFKFAIFVELCAELLFVMRTPHHLC